MWPVDSGSESPWFSLLFQDRLIDPGPGAGPAGELAPASQAVDGLESDDIITVDAGVESVAGGAGADQFVINGSSFGKLASIVDFEPGEDRLVFGAAGAASPDTFLATFAADLDDARAEAERLFAGGVDYVAVQVGEDVIVFADNTGFGVVDAAVRLVGRSLTDVGFGDLG